MKVLLIIAGLILTAYLGIEGYAWHWNPFVVFGAWLAFVLLAIYGFWQFVEAVN